VNEKKRLLARPRELLENLQVLFPLVPVLLAVELAEDDNVRLRIDVAVGAAIHQWSFNDRAELVNGEISRRLYVLCHNQQRSSSGDFWRGLVKREERERMLEKIS